ncbi:GGDEF domain-containing protein [Exilibacterium tricleocarpae]|nr:GGDEF domain-containing protein [Exilibacterium tricleocarpae]
MQHVYIHELMSVSVKSVPADASLDEVVRMMHEHVYSCMVITDDSRPVGIITERDMVKVLSELLVMCPTRTFYVADFMSSPPVCINEDATLYEALVITQARNIRHLPVVNARDELVGVLSYADMTRAHFNAIEKQRDIIEHHIRERTRELSEANEELKALSLQDGLLGIGNRRSMEVDVQFTHINAVRYKRPYALALLDIDYFKYYNDHYGHQAGDEALKAVVKVVQKSVRSSDRLYRYGGEELLLLLPETPLQEAVTVCERATEQLFKEGLPHSKSPYAAVTCSTGITAMVGGCEGDWESMVAEADKWLYQAKEQGRNRVCSGLAALEKHT